MDKVTVYQFTMYDITHDENHKSRRWATRDAIKRVQGDVIENTATEVDASVIATDHAGMSEIGFDPHPRVGFQNTMNIELRKI